MLSPKLVRAARELSRSAFADVHNGRFLVYGMHAAAAARKGGFKTGNFDLDARSEPGSQRTTLRVKTSVPKVGTLVMESAGAAGASAQLFGVLPIVKSERNPYSDRISVGRAASCDVVLPMLEVSKLHAHFLREGDGLGWVVRDAESTNGTFVNEVRAQPGLKVPLWPGDALRLGTCETRFVDGSGLFDYLNALMGARVTSADS